MRRPQFTLRTLLTAMLCAAFFFGGIQFERERRRRADLGAADNGFLDFGVMPRKNNGQPKHRRSRRESANEEPPPPEGSALEWASKQVRQTRPEAGTVEPTP
jgi:hypothetical protein